MSKVKGVFFFIFTAIYITVYVVIAVIRDLFGFDLHGTIRLRQQLGRGIIALNGVKRTVKGSVPDGTYLYISNHRTYMDPIMQAPEAAFVPVAMSEIADWPIMGRGIRASGIVYVKRDSKSSRAATRVAIAKALKEGYSVIIYPEGGTNGLPTTKEFKAGTFRIAAENGFPIIPIAVDYKDQSFYWTSAKSFVAHIINTFGEKMEVKVSFGEPITNTDPDALLAATQSWIDQELVEMRSDWEKQA